MNRSSPGFTPCRFAGGGTLVFRLTAALALVAACLAPGHVHATPVTIDWVTVGNPGNANDTTGYGAVAASFRIMKFEFTNSQYVGFLNAIDPSGTNPFSVYEDSMGSNARGGITNTGTATGSVYAVKENMGDKPVNFVSWFAAARVANWLQNGQGSGSTETGAYTLVGGQTSGTAPAKNPGAQFYIPTEDQWYKAAYYNPTLDSGTGSYRLYGNGFNTTPFIVAADAIGVGSAGVLGPVPPNAANYANGADWNSQNGNVTTVGTNGGASYYGAFDMSGNVWEWNDLTGAAGFRGLRGGGFTNNAPWLSSSERFAGVNASYKNGDHGFRLASPVAVPEPSTWVMGLVGIPCAGWGALRRRTRRPSRPVFVAAAPLALIVACLCTAPAHATPISATVLGYDLVKVGDPGNAADTTGYGSVGTVGGPDFWIGKNHVTIGQYRDFLTAVATLEDPRGLWSASMNSDQRIRGIQRTGSAGAWVYTVVGPNGTNPVGAQSAANRPITYVSWFDSARFANWMANGKPTVTATGSAALAVIDNGAYNLGTATSGNAPAKNTINPNTGAAPTFSIPTENEWYKAAYYSPVKGGPGTPGYYAYGTQSDTAPGNGWDGTTALAITGSANQANYCPDSRLAVTGTTTSIFSTGNQNLLTDVGTFTHSASYYGAFDMSGNVYDWNDLDNTAGSSRGNRGGSVGGDAFDLSSSARFTGDPSFGGEASVGFRLASPVPEPATLGMASGGALCAGGWWVLKRRRRDHGRSSTLPRTQ